MYVAWNRISPEEMLRIKNFKPDQNVSGLQRLFYVVGMYSHPGNYAVGVIRFLDNKEIHIVESCVSKEQRVATDKLKEFIAEYKVRYLVGNKYSNIICDLSALRKIYYACNNLELSELDQNECMITVRHFLNQLRYAPDIKKSWLDELTNFHPDDKEYENPQINMIGNVLNSVKVFVTMLD